MSKHIVEETPSKGSHAQGDNPVEKQASQLAYDVKYKVKQGLGKDTKMNPAQIAKAYLSQLAKSPAPPAVKALAKKKLMGEEYTSDIALLAEKSVVNAMVKVFSEQVDEKKYKVRVTDKKTGNTYIRNATRAKIAELRANPNISSVEMTSYGEVSGDEKSKGKKTAAAKAGKDYDGDGKVESGAKEYRGAVHNAIQRKKGLKPDGKDTSSVKEEVIYEKDEKTEKKDKVITGDKVNNYTGKNSVVKLFPNLGEQAVDTQEKPDSLNKNQQKRQLSTLQQFQNKERQLNQQKLAAQKSGKVPVGSLQVSSYEAEGEVVEETEKKGCGCGKTPCECDEREMPTKMDLFKSKLRAKGIKVAGITPAPRNMKTADELGEAVANRAEYEKVAKAPAPKDDKKVAYSFKDNKDRQRDLKKLARLVRHADGQKRNPAMYNSFEPEGEMTESAEDRLRDRRMERGGVGANVDYSRPPAKKLSNKELGIRDFTPAEKAKRAKEMAAHLKKMRG